MKIAVTGGSGFIGRRLIAYFHQRGHDMIAISRSSQAVVQGAHTVTWKELQDEPGRLEGLDAIVNLAGESINQRWTAAAKERILSLASKQHNMLRNW